MRTVGLGDLYAHFSGTTTLSATTRTRSLTRAGAASVDSVERVGKRRLAHAGDVIAWHNFGVALIEKLGVDELMGSQRLAVAVRAQMDALAVTGPMSATIANAAIACVLATYFPGEAAAINTFAGKLGLPKDKASEAVARTIAAASIAARVGDGTNDDRPIAIPAGKWVPKDPTKPPFRPRWGAVRMWTPANDAVIAPPPPAEGSDIFTDSWKLLRNSADVRKILDTDASAKRKKLAASWVASTKEWENLKPWNDALVAEIKAHKLSPQATAKLLFAYHTVRADAYVAVWKAKYDPVNGFVRRPWQIDPNDPIHESVPLPNSPSYPSGHAGQGGAINALLAQVFPEKSKQWLAMMSEARASRIIGGLSYLFDSASAEMGRKVAVNAMKHLGITA